MPTMMFAMRTTRPEAAARRGLKMCEKELLVFPGPTQDPEHSKPGSDTDLGVIWALFIQSSFSKGAHGVPDPVSCPSHEPAMSRLSESDGRVVAILLSPPPISRVHLSRLAVAQLKLVLSR